MRYFYGMPLAVAIAASLPLTTQAQTTGPVCGPNVKAEISKYIDSSQDYDENKKAELYASLYEKYKFCTADANLTSPNDTFYIAARQCGAKVTYLGSLYYEEMPCCGYDPQRRAFACPVKIKQQSWYGFNPLPGSREHVFHCIADNSGIFRPVGHDSVHLANSQFWPSWQFAVVANANNPDNMHLVQPMNGIPRTARSILSWNLPVTSCDYKPIWGNVIEYAIRLDQ